MEQRTIDYGEVICTEIRKEDGAQKYESPTLIQGVVWLMGADRAAGVRVGTRGNMTYVYGPSWGRYRFTLGGRS